jgi:isoaspartyl peptidase/L-asparaginase-like protein (Ntn-hydrolase superfamily)
MSARPDYVLAIHGGAGPKPGRDYGEVSSHLAELISEGEKSLQNNASAIDVVEDIVSKLEMSGLYVAGRGSAPNAKGIVEMDAAIMDGGRTKAGSIAAVRDLVSPIKGARAVLEKTPHILLAGSGADNFCQEMGIERILNPASWYRLPVGVTEQETRTDELSHGTVGAVALDRQGCLAAATSTGGLFGKRSGRIGDTPIIGMGTWADKSVALSCTGLGEYFMVCNAAYDVAARMKYAKMDLQEAATATLKTIADLGGDGGLVAIDASGQVILPFNSDGMKRAFVVAGKKAKVGVFDYI